MAVCHKSEYPPAPKESARILQCHKRLRNKPLYRKTPAAPAASAAAAKAAAAAAAAKAAAAKAAAAVKAAAVEKGGKDDK